MTEKQEKTETIRERIESHGGDLETWLAAELAALADLDQHGYDQPATPVLDLAVGHVLLRTASTVLKSTKFATRVEQLANENHETFLDAHAEFLADHVIIPAIAELLSPTKEEPA